MRRSVLHRVVAGGIVQHDENDEPAAALVNRAKLRAVEVPARAKRPVRKAKVA
jgi:hypothetical protein